MCEWNPVGPDLAIFRQFGKILKVFWKMFSAYQYLANFLPFSANIFEWNWANFHCCKWSNIEQIIQPSGHTGGTHPPLRFSNLNDFLSLFVFAESFIQDDAKQLWGRVCCCCSQLHSNNDDYTVQVKNFSRGRRFEEEMQKG